MADSMWLFSNTSNPLHFSKCGIVVVTPCGPTSKVAQVLEKWPTPSAILARNGRQLWGPLEAQSCRPFRFEMADSMWLFSNTSSLLHFEEFMGNTRGPSAILARNGRQGLTVSAVFRGSKNSWATHEGRRPFWPGTADRG